MTPPGAPGAPPLPETAPPPLGTAAPPASAPAATARTGVPSGWRVAHALAGAVLSLLTAVAFAPAFGRTPVEALTQPRYALPVAGVVATVTAVCVLLAIGTRVVPVTRVASALGALTVYVVLVVAPGAAIVDGPKRLFTSALPMEPTGAELAAVVMCVGLTTLAAVEPGLRRPATALPLIGPFAATALGSAVSSGVGPPPGWLAPVLAFGAAAVLLLARYAPGPVRAVVPAGENAAAGVRRRRFAALLLACVVVAAAAVASAYGVGLFAHGGQGAPADARNLVPQPVQPREDTSPLAMFPALQQGDRSMALTVRAAAPPRQNRLRYVTLDEFDGEYWNTSARYRRTGGRLPVRRPERPVSEREERVTVDRAGPLGWLPASARPVEVSVSGLGVDEETGDVVFPADRPVPREYTVRSAVPAPPDAAALRAARASPSRATGTRVTPELADRAKRIAGGDVDYAALRRLDAYFDPARPGTPGTPNFRVDRTAKAPGGHGLLHIGRLLETQRGTAEQYASAFAVMARALGYDARVVMGFQTRAGGAGTYVARERDVHAWVEVHFAGVGWVDFDPTPSRTTTQVNQPATPPDTPPPPKRADDDKQAPPPPSPPKALPTQPSADPAGLVTSIALAALLVLVAGYAGGVPLVKRERRRRRRRQGDPDRRTLAAWRDTLDRLAERGLGVAAADTSGEVVATTQARFGGELAQDLRHLALLHDQAAFAPGSLGDPAAGEAWRHADAARARIRTATPPLGRLLAALDPRPLRRRARRS